MGAWGGIAAKSFGQDLSKRARKLQGSEGLGGEVSCFVSGDGLFKKSWWGDFGGAQRNGAFNDNGQGENGTNKEGPNGPASGLNN